MPQATKRRLSEGFDVVCTVGRVEFTNDPLAEHPRVSAMRLIAEHGAEGHYSFPHEDGGTCHVAVHFEGARAS